MKRAEWHSVGDERIYAPTQCAAVRKVRKVIRSGVGQGKKFCFESRVKHSAKSRAVRRAYQSAYYVLTLFGGNLQLAFSDLAFTDSAGAVVPQKCGISQQRAI